MDNQGEINTGYLVRYARRGERADMKVMMTFVSDRLPNARGSVALLKQNGFVEVERDEYEAIEMATRV